MLFRTRLGNLESQSYGGQPLILMLVILLLILKQIEINITKLMIMYVKWWEL